LGLPVAAEQKAEIIVPRDNTLQLDAIDQKNCQGDFALADMV
jgi:hypothetical protein